MKVVEAANLLVASVAAIATAVIGWIAFRLSKQSQRYSAQRSIGDLQIAVVRFRAEYPEIVSTAPKWGDHQSAVLLGRIESPNRDSVVRYYSYVELGLEFCNTVLASQAKGWISDDVFEKHYRPLVRYFLAENQPFVAYALEGPYLSEYVRTEWAAAESEGWDWQQRFQRLAGSNSEDLLSVPKAE